MIQKTEIYRNPFKFGEVVKGEDFADRKKEVKEIIEDVYNSVNIFLISPRRYGKTSLIMKVFEELSERNFIKIFIDFYTISDVNHLLQKLSSEIIKNSYKKLNLVMERIKDFFTSVKPLVKLTADGSFVLDFERIDKTMLIEEVLDLPGKVTEERRKRMVIVFDEFQEVRNFNGCNIEKIMRAKFQHHDRVSYIFMGSKERIMEEMVTLPESPFYNLGKIIYLDKIPIDEFKRFIWKKFTSTGFKVEESVIEKILDFTNNIPYYVQMFCYNLWNEKLWEKKIRLSDIEDCVKKIVKQNESYFIEIWDNLTSYQRRVLIALANKEVDERIYSYSFIRRFNLKSISSLQKAVAAIIKKRILHNKKEEMKFTDPFFCYWIKSEFSL